MRVILSGIVIVLAAIFSTAPRVSAQPCDVNLLVNPGCDEPLAGGEIPGWVEVRGTDWTCQSANPPFGGSPGYFFAGSADTAELIQELNVAAYANTGFPISLYALVRTRDESPSDVARVIFELRDQANILLETYDSGDVVSPGSWMSVLGCCYEFQGGAETIRVRLIGIRHNGPENNTYFDSVQVYPVCGLPVESSTWGRIKALRYEAQ